MSDKDEAHALLDDFEKRTGAPSVWPHISRSDLAAGLRTRVDDPDQINQGQTSLCGPADFFRDLAIENPKGYVQAAIDLYEKGITYVGSQKIKPSSDLKGYSVPARANINVADWILCASLRDQDNWFFDYQSTDDAVSAITLPHSLASWFRKEGYTDVVNDTNLVACKDLSNAREANRRFKKSYKISLFINANMLDENDQDTPSVSPDHWVALTSPISFMDIEADPASKVSFQVYTWGEGHRPVSRSGSLSIKQFLFNYYGYIACKR